MSQAVLDNPTCFTNPFQFEITFECLQELDDDLEWKVLYVGSAQDAAKDQILDEILVGPVPVGVNKFVLQADAPDPSQLAQDDLLGVTVVLVTCSYKEREFVRVGYYVNNEYHDPNAPTPPVAAAAADGSQPDAPPGPPPIPNPVPLEHIQRQILADKPRVTKFPISWGDEAPAATTNGNNAAVASNATGAGMMADHASAMMTGAASMATAVTVTPPGNQYHPHHDASAMEEEDIMDEEELSVDEEDEAGDVSNSGDANGIVSMPEESNMSHVYFANSSNNSNNNGVQAMAE